MPTSAIPIGACEKELENCSVARRRASSWARRRLMSRVVLWRPSGDPSRPAEQPDGAAHPDPPAVRPAHAELGGRRLAALHELQARPVALHGVLGVDEVEGRAPDHLLGPPAVDPLGRGRDVEVAVVHVHPRHDVARLHRQQSEALLAARQGGPQLVLLAHVAQAGDHAGDRAVVAAERHRVDRRPTGGGRPRSRMPMRAPSWASPVARARAVGRSSAGQTRPSAAMQRQAASPAGPRRGRPRRPQHLGRHGGSRRPDGRPRRAPGRPRTAGRLGAGGGRPRCGRGPASAARAAESTASRRPPAPVTAAASTSRAIVQSATGPCGAGSPPPGGISSDRSRGRTAARPPGSTCGP